MNVEKREMEFLSLGQRTRCQLNCEEESLTRQSLVQETIIENILAKYRQTGIVDNQAKGTPRYDEFMSQADYKESLDKVFEVEEAFDQLTADQRAYFENDPLKFLNALDGLKAEGSEIQMDIEEYIQIQSGSEGLGIQPMETPGGVEEVENEPEGE